MIFYALQVIKPAMRFVFFILYCMGVFFMYIFIVILSFLIFFLSSISVFIDKSLQLTRHLLDNDDFMLYNNENKGLRGDDFERKRASEKNY